LRLPGGHALEHLQRAICGAKNFFKADIYLKWWTYFLATVKDDDDLVKSRRTSLFENLQSMNSSTYKPQNGEF
jgi:hypothetical protein